MIRVVVWNEYRHEKIPGHKSAEVYPNGIHNAIKDFLSSDDISVEVATLDDEGAGITADLLKDTDVLIWWGHIAHNEVPDEVALAVRDAVHDGMGFIALHSAHHSKPFKLLMGTSCNLTWRESDDSEVLWVIEPHHPITRGVDRYFKLPAVETYGEPFAVPTPEKVLLIGNYTGGEVFRSAMLFERCGGKIFYFQPGHETFPIFYDKNVQTIIRNAVRYVAPTVRMTIGCPHVRTISSGEPYEV